MAKIDRVQEVSTEMIRPYSRNAKIHTDEQVEKIAKSIQEFGFLNPCLIDRDFNLIAGHGRVMAAKKLGMETVPCVYIEGLSEAQKRAYILADNKLAELAEWDHDLVSDELERLRDEGFDIDITGFEIDDIEFDENEDVAPILEPSTIQAKEPRIKRGEIWQLGDHRLMCGDSTEPNDVSRLMGGEQADLIVTDPPYNVGLGVGETLEEIIRRKRRTDGLVIENDAMNDDEFGEFLFAAFSNAARHMKPGAAYYCWYASASQRIAQEALERSGLAPRQILIWVKHYMVLGRQDYQWRHEPCFYGWKEGGAHYFIDVRSLTTVSDDLENLTKEELIERIKDLCSITTTIYEDKPTRSEFHPTMKPLGLFKKQIRNSSREGENVLDLFGGSGTTLIACEDMRRHCFMMEYDPHYAEVIIERWEEKTGKVAVKL